MELKAGEVFSAYQALGKLSEQQLPVKGAYWVARMLKKLNSEFVAIDERRNELIRKHGTEQDGQVVVKPEAMPAFMADFNQVVDATITVDCPMLKLDVLGDVMVPGDLMLPLAPFVEE